MWEHTDRWVSFNLLKTNVSVLVRMTAGDDKKKCLTTNDCYFMNITNINNCGNSGLVDSVSVKIDDCTIWTGTPLRCIRG